MIKELNTENLMAAVDRYPWFAAGRAELCFRTLETSGKDAAQAVLKDSLAYLPFAAVVSLRLRNAETQDFKDADIAKAIRSAIEHQPRIVIPGQDFFSLSEYESVRTDEDSALSRIAIVDYSAPEPPKKRMSLEDEIELKVTETLAQIYVDQGYPERAKEIYMKLSLLNPEKSAYFASLIEKL